MANDTQDWSVAGVQPAVHLATVSVAANGNTTATLTPPAGCHGLFITTPDSSGRIALRNVLGHVTGNFYWAAPGAAQVPLQGTALVIPIALDPAYESQVDISFNSIYPALAIPVDIFAVMDVENLVNAAADPLFVQLAGAQATVPVSASQSPPAFDLYGDHYTGSGNGGFTAIANQASVTLLAGVAGQSLYLFDVTIEFSVAVGADMILEDTGLVTFDLLQGALTHQVYVRGLKTAAGRGLALFNNSGAGQNYRFAAVYTVGL